MNYELDRNAFATVMAVTWQSFGRNRPERETMRYWFDKLAAHDLSVVSHAFDEWLKTQKELPTVADITSLCRPAAQIYTAIEHKPDVEANRQHSHEVVEYVRDNMKPQTDHKAWARRILDNKLNPNTGRPWAEISIRFAKEALGL